MDMTGEYRIPAPRQRVWEALNDPEILKAAIPGCEELTKVGDNDLEARVRAKVGPVSATFTGKVTLGDLNPPESYRISGEGKGGAAGFAKAVRRSISPRTVRIRSCATAPRPMSAASSPRSARG